MTPESFAGQEVLLLPETLLLPEGPVRDHAVVVADGIFREVGPADQVRDNPALTPVRLDNHLLMPGFVDTHHHLTQSFGKSLVFGEPSEIFRRVWVPLEHSLDEDVAYVASKLAALESLRGGFTTVCDAGTRAPIDLGAVATATRDAGIRCVLALTCNDVDSPLDPQAVLRKAEEHLARWEGERLVHPSLAVSVPEAGTDRVLHDASQLCAEAGTVFQTHVNEHLASVERSLDRRGVRPLEHLHDVGALGRQVLASHATLVTPRELRLLAETDTAVSYNPVASAWKGNGVAPATAMAEQGIRFGIGTDATRGDAFRLLDAAETAQRLAYGLEVGDSSCGGGWTWLHHATAGGADAAGLGQITGEIAVGRAADFLVVDCDVPEMQPSWTRCGSWSGWPTGTRSPLWWSREGCVSGAGGRPTGTAARWCRKPPNSPATWSSRPRSDGCTRHRPSTGDGTTRQRVPLPLPVRGGPRCGRSHQDLEPLHPHPRTPSTTQGNLGEH